MPRHWSSQSALAGPGGWNYPDSLEVGNPGLTLADLALPHEQLAGRPRPSEVIAYWPALIPKDRVHTEVRVLEV